MDQTFIWYLKKHASVRLTNCLMRYGINKITRYTDIEEVKVRHLGLRSKANFKEVQQSFLKKIEVIQSKKSVTS
jgi:DNA-directed RNA polymerase alpha subunit